MPVRLKAPDAPRALLLMGDPGWGKTAFAGHLFSVNPGGQLLAAHFCRADRADSIDPRRFIESLVAMAAMRIPDFEARILSVSDKHEGLLHKPPLNAAFEQLYLEPLAALDPGMLGELPRYILVDSLDEAASTADTQSAIGWIDIGCGGYKLKLSGYFEAQATAIQGDWAKIESELT